jgi:hypothetical protein
MSRSHSSPQVALLDPGVGITAAGVTVSGTSQATPFITAAVALVRQKYPVYTRDQIVALLKSTGVPVRHATLQDLCAAHTLWYSERVNACAQGSSLLRTPHARLCLQMYK